MINRVYVEKKNQFAHQAISLKHELVNLLGIKSISSIRIVNRYDVENIEESVFAQSVKYVFSEPQVDIVSDILDVSDDDKVFAVEYLPGQFDQRADSAAQCIQIISQGDKPIVASAKVYVVSGNISDSDLDKIQKYVLNPVESRLASLDDKKTLQIDYEIPEDVAVLSEFNNLDARGLSDFIGEIGLAMDDGDIKFCQEYFANVEKRNPTITEIKMIDTYWSDHCRHTTFSTIIDDVHFEDDLAESTFQNYLSTRKELGRTKPVTLMDLATVAVKYLRSTGQLDKMDVSEEINACTVKIDVNVEGKEEPWLLLFKNETHNHPTEIEPFGGAATCVGGAIRDPLSGRSYVYGAMRVTGAGDPTVDINKTLPGKLPQRKIVTTAADGYSSYGNQIGLATGIVDELYHPGYVAKRMEIGAVIGAAPAKNVVREVPACGDVVIYLGGSTGRDGIGGATGSSKAHDSHSVETCGAEVQKGNAPEERKIQRFFRNPKVTTMIKRCNDFGAGGVSVAIGELADGLDIDLDKVPKKYEGLDGTELAISESQERMAVVVAPESVDDFLALANSENLQACVVAKVSDNNRLCMKWRGKTIVDISRDFLNSNGAEKHISINVKAENNTNDRFVHKSNLPKSFVDGIKKVVKDVNCASKRGLCETFDSTIGAGTVLMPFGGKYQLTPAQAMVQLVSVEKGHTDTCSLMSYGFNPYLSESDQFYGSYIAVVESVCKLIACGASFDEVYLTFQEYFERLEQDADKWGHPLSALLGAYKAQMDLCIGAIGGKDSMSGTFEDIHVPPTLVSFAVTTAKADDIVSPEFKGAGNAVYLLKPDLDENGLVVAESLKKNFDIVHKLCQSGLACSVYTPGMGGIAEAVFKMAIGNGFGFNFDDDVKINEIFDYSYGSFVIEINDDNQTADGQEFKYSNTVLLGKINSEQKFVFGNEEIDLQDILEIYENTLEDVYHCNIDNEDTDIEDFVYKGSCKDKADFPGLISIAKPKVVIPVFPGNNCEYDTAKIFSDAGADAKIFVVNNLSKEGIHDSIDKFCSTVDDSQMIFIPGGFSAGDEPDGSGKFITAFFRNREVADSVSALLDERGGLIAGICNGFQALIKLGLVPFGRIVDTDDNCPTLTFNTIGRHQSKIVRTKICSNMSPWLSKINTGDIINVAISHGEGRFVARDEVIHDLATNGQIATQYVDLDGHATNDIAFNPNNSNYAIEGITSKDGRVFGKMGHSERWSAGLYKNVPGNYDYKMFEGAVSFFK